MPRFYAGPDATQGKTILLDKNESRHALLVLRMKEGDEVELFDGKGRDFKGRMVAVKEDGRVWIEVLKAQPSASKGPLTGLAPVKITLAAAVIKPERMDLLIQKSCELGVAEIAPLITERCVVRLSKERWKAKAERWRKIALETCKQCGQAELPVVREALDFKVFIKTARSYDAVLIPTLAARGDILYTRLKEVGKGSILVFIGPEGDFTASEVKLAEAQGAVPVTLGPLVLRSETAAIYLLSVMNFFYREAVGRR